MISSKFTLNFFLGIMANNPTLDVLTEIAEYNLALRSADRADEVIEPEVMLSLGTGVPPIRKVSKISNHHSRHVWIICETPLAKGPQNIILFLSTDRSGWYIPTRKCIGYGKTFHELGWNGKIDARKVFSVIMRLINEEIYFKVCILWCMYFTFPIVVSWMLTIE